MKNPILHILLAGLLVLLVSSRSPYKVVNSAVTSSSVTLDLLYTGNQEYHIKPTSPIIKNLRFLFRTYTFNDFDFKIIDSKKERFEVPQEGIFPIDPLKNFSFPINISAVKFEYTENPFDFRIIRKSNNAILFSTYEGNFTYSDYYLEISTVISNEYIYGLGERFNSGFRLRDGKWTIFNRDRGQVIDKGQGYQTYGYYPFYLQR